MSAPFALEWLERPPYRDLHPRFRHAVAACEAWPDPAQYDALAEHVPRAAGAERPRFVVEDREAMRRAGGYERHVARLRAVPTRPGSWHDFFNMTVWAHFPELRWALNAIHVDPNIGPIDPRNGRAPAQNLAASFDESGMILLCTSREIIDELQGLRFQRAFWQRRAEVLETTRYWVVGHGLLESLLVPRAGLVARALVLHVSSLPTPDASDAHRFALDAQVAAGIHDWRHARPVLDPIPVLAIPGFSDNDSAAFYDDPRNVRFVPVSRRPSASG